MLLNDVAKALNVPEAPANPGVTGVTHNAAWVEPGNIYLAIRGAKFDGHDFIAEAAQRGAAAVAGEGLPTDATCPLPYLTVPHARQALADLAALFANYPSRDLRVVGVTGTDGKTTTSWLTCHLLRAAGLQTGLFSTAGYQLPDAHTRQFPAHFTTPEAPQLQAILREMVAAGAQAAVVEASSHALALDRVRGVEWDAAIWTHLSSEHLDFHGSVEGYFADKRRLIEASPFAILNADDPWTSKLRGIAPEEVSYSESGDSSADWHAHDIHQGPDGLKFLVRSPLGEFAAEFPMIGAFNVANALAGLAAAARLGATRDQLISGLASFAGVPGRMQLIAAPQPDAQPRVIVDFAHTPPSLEKALQTLRATTSGELWVVLGSAGGPRDPSKRAPLGDTATQFADHAIFTEEDCRDTPIWDILHEMERGARQQGRTNFQSIPNRWDAIDFAIGHARPGDTVVLAGKGPEETLERATETIPWDEAAEAAEALRRYS